MQQKLESLLKFLKDLFENNFTGQLRLNFHEGNLSEKVEKKESVKLDEVGLLCAKLKAKQCRENILTSPPERKE